MEIPKPDEIDEFSEERLQGEHEKKRGERTALSNSSCDRHYTQTSASRKRAANARVERLNGVYKAVWEAKGGEQRKNIDVLNPVKRFRLVQRNNVTANTLRSSIRKKVSSKQQVRVDSTSRNRTGLTTIHKRTYDPTEALCKGGSQQLIIRI